MKFRIGGRLVTNAMSMIKRELSASNTLANELHVPWKRQVSGLSVPWWAVDAVCTCVSADFLSRQRVLEER